VLYKRNIITLQRSKKHNQVSKSSKAKPFIMSGNSDNQDKDDLDGFLTALEQKMRGPYSSLEIAKVVATHSLRGNNVTPQQYLAKVSRVLPRTDKLTQLKTLIGLLGLERSNSTDKEVYKILTEAQEGKFEEWVRVIAGLVRGILFVDEEEESKGEEGKKTATRESCRGEEASKLLDKTCQDIINQTRLLEKETASASSHDANGNNHDKLPSLETADLYPLFVPYRYSLLDRPLLDRVIPEHLENPHFNFDAKADILSFDEQQEKSKLLESQEHKVANVKQAPVPGAQKASKPEANTAGFPGFKPTKKVAPKTTGAAARPKASLFIPAKRPGAPAGRGGRQIPVRYSV